MTQTTPARLHAMLDEQIDYLDVSAALYDTGRRHEAKRLAVTTRVLVHDTRQSSSLLAQLGVKSKLDFLDSAGDINPRNMLFETPMLMFRMEATADQGLVGTYLPILGDGPPLPGRDRPLPFREWWSRDIVRDGAGERFSRRDLVLFLANKAGGAHVDPKVQKRIDALAKSETIGFVFSDGVTEQAVEEDPILPMVRQIAYELRETLHRGQGLLTEPAPDAAAE